MKPKERKIRKKERRKRKKERYRSKREPTPAQERIDESLEERDQAKDKKGVENLDHVWLNGHCVSKKVDLAVHVDRLVSPPGRLLVEQGPKRGNRQKDYEDSKERLHVLNQPPAIVIHGVVKPMGKFDMRIPLA